MLKRSDRPRSAAASCSQAPPSLRRRPSSSPWAGKPRAATPAFFWAQDKGYFKAEGLERGRSIRAKARARP